MRTKPYASIEAHSFYQSVTKPAQEAGSCFQVWRSPRAWLLLFPICYFIVQGSIQTGTVAVQLRLALQADTFWGRWGFIFLILGSLGIAAANFGKIWPGIVANKPIVGLALLAVVSMFWSDVKVHTLLNGMGAVAVTLLVIYLIYEFNPEEQMQLIILPGFVAMVCSFGVVFLAPGIGVEGDQGGAWCGIFGAKNNLGLVALLLATPFIHLPLQRLPSKIFRVVYLSLALVLIVMSRAKTAWCVAGLYLALALILVILRKFRTRDSVILGLAIGIVSTATAVFIYQKSGSILELLGKDPTISQRTIIWAAVWKSISKNLFLGYGFDAFWRGLGGPSLDIILSSGWMLAQAQNGYLDLWLSVGLVGVALLVMIVWRAFRDSLICLQLKGSPSLDWYMGILLSTVIYNFSESFLLDPRHIAWITFLIACVGLRKAAIRLRSANNRSKEVYQTLRFAHPVGR